MFAANDPKARKKMEINRHRHNVYQYVRVCVLDFRLSTGLNSIVHVATMTGKTSVGKGKGNGTA